MELFLICKIRVRLNITNTTRHGQHSVQLWQVGDGEVTTLSSNPLYISIFVESRPNASLSWKLGWSKWREGSKWRWILWERCREKIWLLSANIIGIKYLVLCCKVSFKPSIFGFLSEPGLSRSFLPWEKTFWQPIVCKVGLID